MHMRFFTSFAKSLSNLNWLRGTRKAPGQHAWSYFFLLIFFLAGLTLIPLFVNLPQMAREFRSLANDKVPNFTAVLKNGELSVMDMQQPHVLHGDGMVVVINTIATGTLSIKDYLNKDVKSGILIAKDRAEIYDANKGQDRIQYWKDVPDYSLNKEQLMEKVNKYLSPVFIFLAALVLFILFYAGMIIGKLFTILVVSAVITFLAVISKRDWKFKEIFATGLYVITLPAVLIMVFGWSGLVVGGLQLVMTLVWLGLVVLGERKQQLEAQK